MRATPAEHRFKEACRVLIRRGIHPTPMHLNTELKRNRPGRRIHHLNGREVTWRRELVPRISSGPGELCQLFCCKAGGDFPYDEIALTCSNNHFELVRVICVGDRILLGSGAGLCPYCDEWRHTDEVAMKLDEVLRRSRPLPPPCVKLGTIDEGLSVGSSIKIVAFILGLMGLIAGLTVLEHFFGG